MSHSAMTRGGDWCMNMVLSVGELSCLSMFVCTLDASLDAADSLLPTAPLLDLFYLVDAY